MTSRKPPEHVLNILRKEVGFRCPADGIDGPCGDPLLTWHHFDPPWRDGGTHEPDGMIALCQVHHKMADNKAYTDEQLRRYKIEGLERSDVVRGRFAWQRREIVARVGGLVYYQTMIPLKFNESPVVWFNRNTYGELLLNFKMPKAAGEPEVVIEDNVWTTDTPGLDLLVCKPGGRSIEIKFINGDEFKAEFSAADTHEQIEAICGISLPDIFSFPVTVLELWETLTIKDKRVELGPGGTGTAAGSASNLFISGFDGERAGFNITYRPPQPSAAMAALLDEFHRLEREKP